MREIKFRAWHKEEKQMLEVESLHFGFYREKIKSLEVCWLDYSGDKRRITGNAKIEKIELMQFTGLHDKNGKEIYEGDIVSLKSQYETDIPIDTKSRVEFSDGSFRLDFHGMILNWAVLEYTKSNWLIEVIGNIWENPELLK